MKHLLLLSTILISNILLAQNVGIGVASPLAPLHVAGGSVLFSANGDISGMPGLPPQQGPGRRMMWFSDKAAFRVGYVGSDHWDQYNIGNYSFAAGKSTTASGNHSTALGHGAYASGLGSIAMGNESIANGDYSTAIGFLPSASGYISIALGRETIASGDFSTAIGNFSTASGSQSVVIGELLNAKSGYETVLGRWNTDYEPVATSGWYPTDRLFTIGNGTGSLYRSDALTILKNGKTGIGIPNPIFQLDVRNGSINTDSLYRIGTITVLTVPGDGNLFVGKNVGRTNTGIGNTFSGEQAGEDNTSGFYNSFYGRGAGGNNTMGDYNSLFGQAAGSNNTSGDENSFFGSASGFGNTMGSYNSFFGRFAGYLNLIGSSNSFFGHSAGTYNDIGQFNAFFGNGAGGYNTSGNSNTAIGCGSFNSNYTGERNTALGYVANVSTSALTNATAIGANATVECSNCLVLGSVNTFNGATSNVKVGIGNTNPGFPLSFAPALGDKISLWSNSSNSYGFGVQSALLQIHSDVSYANIAFGYGSSDSFNERMRIVNLGDVGIELNGRITLKNGTLPVNNAYGPGIWLYNSDNSAVLGFMGTQNNQNMGFYGGPAGWGFTYDAINSRVGIGNQSPDYPFEVNGDAFFAGYFVNTGSSGGIGVGGKCTNSLGFGVAGEGGDVGVYGEGGNWGGWFLGDIYTTGNYEGSDRKLKNDIRALNGALSIINQLSPSVYTYKTNEFKQMRLPEGLHYGLIADEVQNILPGIVKKAVQAARYENHDALNGKKLSDEIEFNAVKYTEIIPILIGAVQEQQVMIEELKMKNQQIEQQQQQINYLLAEIQQIKAKLK